VKTFRSMEDTTPEQYSAIGMKSGLEIHQQLDTMKKLFCRCPVRPYTEEFHAEILRHMRPTLSELGEYDGTALMEFKTKKDIIYQIHQDTVCTYEMDDTPPFELNEEALDIALEVTMLLNCKLVSELHIARKQYLDGSIPTGFQRTTILGVDGSIPFDNERRIRIRQLGLEEDACREVSDEGHMRVYRTDRLGIPLIETVTEPDMHTPQEVAAVAQRLRWLARSTGRVRTGIGAARQDVNVSVEGGRRVEIKGVSRIPLIPLLVHTEAYRQVALLEIKKELERRKITPSSFESDTHDITDTLRTTSYYPVAKALKHGLRVRAVVLRGYRGILPMRTQPETTFAKEISDRVRVIACLDLLPNIAHSDMEGETLSSTEWTKIKKLCRTGENDAVVVVWGSERDVETGASEIVLRAREALDGVPNETRQAMPDGTNGFERILPGPDRMYPDTDLPPLAITEERIQRIQAILPELPWARETRYRELGLRPDIARRLSIARERDLFDRIVEQTDYEPSSIAFFLLGRFRAECHWGAECDCTDGTIIEALARASKAHVPNDAFLPLLCQVCDGKTQTSSDAEWAFEDLDGKEIEKEITGLLKKIEIPPISKDKLKRYLMGRVRERFPWQIEGKRLSTLVDEHLAAAGGEKSGKK
jgi:glutamyl-tRNA(Gln) amidotransferase subunit E